MSLNKYPVLFNKNCASEVATSNLNDSYSTASNQEEIANLKMSHHFCSSIFMLSEIEVPYFQAETGRQLGCLFSGGQAFVL